MTKTKARFVGLAAAILILRVRSHNVEETRGGLLVDGKFAHTRFRSTPLLITTDRPAGSWKRNSSSSPSLTSS
jgi:hypothetical protein